MFVQSWKKTSGKICQRHIINYPAILSMVSLLVYLSRQMTRLQEPARHASEPVSQASEPARQASEPASQASKALRPAWLALRPDWLGLRPAWLALGPSRGGRKYGRMNERTDGRMDGCTENLPILQDFVPCCPKRWKKEDENPLMANVL